MEGLDIEEAGAGAARYERIGPTMRVKMSGAWAALVLAGLGPLAGVTECSEVISQLQSEICEPFCVGREGNFISTSLLTKSLEKDPRRGKR